ncbi:MAG: ATP-binding cassette domain-containing protein [Oscillospiraceae bacterium]|nr:ATP-binding cassette domain-containing protein [Oscillospiraceae bacterium]
MPAIVLDNVSKFYKSDGRIEAAVRDVSLTINQGEFVFVVGSSGSGKSTLLQLMSGEIKPERGKVYLNDQDLQRLMRWKRTSVSLMFGQVWQDHTLMRKRTVEENLRVAAIIGAARRRDTKWDIQERVNKVLGLVGMQGTQKKYPAELSGGEVRRVELARAMINSPHILILDEITANLDEDNIWDIFEILKEVNRRGTTVVMATHASQFVNIMYRRVITMVDGRVFGDVARGKYGDIL